MEPPRLLLDSLVLQHLLVYLLQFLDQGRLFVHRLHDPDLIRAKLLQFGLEEGVLLVSDGFLVENQDRGDIVCSDLGSHHVSSIPTIASDHFCIPFL